MLRYGIDEINFAVINMDAVHGPRLGGEFGGSNCPIPPATALTVKELREFGQNGLLPYAKRIWQRANQLDASIKPTAVLVMAHVHPSGAVCLIVTAAGGIETTIPEQLEEILPVLQKRLFAS